MIRSGDSIRGQDIGRRLITSKTKVAFESYLQRNPTQLTLTLASVSVARVEERALVPDREIDRSGLWIQEFGAGKRPARDVLLGSDATLERVVAVDHDRLPRTHARDRFTIWAEHVAV
jgi:hypothetical protein